MANEFLMAIGLSYLLNNEGNDKEPPSIIVTMGKFKPSFSIVSVGKNKGYLIIESYEKAETVIKSLYTYNSDLNNNISEEDKLGFYMVLTTINSEENSNLDDRTAIIFRTIGVLDSTMKKMQEQTLPYPMQIYITGEVYKDLPSSYRDLYHSSIEIASNVVHQRFSEDAQRCFVVSPIDEGCSQIRTRANHIFERYIKPACENTPFRAVRGDMMQGNRIMSEVAEALQSDPMVVVYLGNPKWGGWNPNVMFELGARTITSAPYVVIKDSTSEDKPYALPFDIKDNRIVDVPEHEDDEPENIATKIRTIRDMILAGQKENPWNYLYPSATIDIKFGDPKDSAKESRFIDVSSDLEALFELKGMAGKGLITVIEQLLKKMPPVQRQPFLDEQWNLMTQLAAPPRPQMALPDIGVHVHATIPKAYATLPIVFQEHRQYTGQAFLPIIVRYSFNQITNVLKLRVLYIEVTSTTRPLAPGGPYVCILHGNEKMDLNSTMNLSLKETEQR